jgi:hypothetical protein
MNREFAAPWGSTLKWTSVLLTALCLGIPLGILLSVPELHPASMVFLLGVCLPLLVLAGPLLFMVRGYAVATDAILIARPFWTTRLPLHGLRSVAVSPGALGGSIRLFGTGGAFSFTGWFWNRRDGGFRVWVNDLNRTVLLKFTDKTVVLAPDDPQAFEAAILATRPELSKQRLGSDLP